MIPNLDFAWKACAFITLLSAAGCSSDAPVDIGDGKRGEALSDYADVWDGYAEAYEFLDGSDRVRITLDPEGNGVLQVGDSEEAPDPAPTAGGRPPTFGAPNISPGVAYRIQGASVEGARLRLGANYPSLGPWCEAQPPVLFNPEDSPGVYSCFAYIEGFEQATRNVIDEATDTCEDTETRQIVPCYVPFACWHYCACTASGCQGASAETPAVVPSEYAPEDPIPFEDSFARLDAALSENGQTLTGTLVGNLFGGRVTVRLERQ